MKEENDNIQDEEQKAANNNGGQTGSDTPQDTTADKADSPSEAVIALTEAIKEQATEDEAPQSRYFSLRKILGGDILSTAFMRRQVWLFLLIAFFLVVYIANRYSCQKDIIEIDQLETRLKDAKYKALSSNSKLTEKSRQSNVLKMLKDNNDSTLKMPTQPPYIINVPE